MVNTPDVIYNTACFACFFFFLSLSLLLLQIKEYARRRLASTPQIGYFGGGHGGVGGGGGRGGASRPGGATSGVGSRHGGLSDDVDFTERSVPPWLGESPKRKQSDAHASGRSAPAGCPPEAFAALEAKLDARPVWARLALLEALPEKVRDAAKKCLPFVAYRFANGPFRRLLIKRGVRRVVLRFFYFFNHT